MGCTGLKRARSILWGLPREEPGQERQRMEKDTFKILSGFPSTCRSSQGDLIPILYPYSGHRGRGEMPQRCLEANSSNTGKLDLTYIVSDSERGAALMKDPSPCLWVQIQALVSTTMSEEDQRNQVNINIPLSPRTAPLHQRGVQGPFEARHPSGSPHKVPQGPGDHIFR